jgi:folate-binding protein YgfZ
MTELTNPLECGLNRYVSFTKGCYIGQEVIARLDAYDKISKHMVGIRSETEIPINGSTGDVKLLADNKECGFVTSSCISDKFGNIGLGFVKTIFLDYEKPYILSYGGNSFKCEIMKLPLTSKRVNQAVKDCLDDAIYSFSKAIELPTKNLLYWFHGDRISKHFGDVEDAKLNPETFGTRGLIKILNRIYHVIIFLSTLLLFL